VNIQQFQHGAATFCKFWQMSMRHENETSTSEINTVAKSVPQQAKWRKRKQHCNAQLKFHTDFNQAQLLKVI
jgi:hypothetical protein